MIKFKSSQPFIINHGSNSRQSLQPSSSRYFNIINDQKNLNAPNVVHSQKLTPKKISSDDVRLIESNLCGDDDFSSRCQENVAPSLPQYFNGPDLCSAADLEPVRPANRDKDFDEPLAVPRISSRSKTIHKEKIQPKFLQKTVPLRTSYSLLEDLLIVKYFIPGAVNWNLMSQKFKNLNLDRNPKMLKNRYFSYIKKATNELELRLMLVDLEHKLETDFSNIPRKYITEFIGIVEKFKKFKPLFSTISE